MGLIDFIKDAGAKIYGLGKTTKEKQAETAKTDAAEHQKMVDREMEEDRNAERALFDNINKLGLKVSGLKIQILDDKATVSGFAENQATREKVVLIVGNTAGIAKVQDDMTVEVQEPEATYHTVQSGDTLSKIAKEVYGNANDYNKIFEANKPMLSDPNKIYPGQVLRIPN